MADFAIFAVACEVGRTGSGEEFLRAYRENQAGANEQVLDDSPVATAIQRLMANRVEWRGTSTELLEGLNRILSESERADRAWPKRPNTLSGKLKRLAPVLRRAARIDVQIGEKSWDRNRTRHTVMRRIPEVSAGRIPTVPSAAPTLSTFLDDASDAAEPVDRPQTVPPSSDPNSSHQQAGGLPVGTWKPLASRIRFLGPKGRNTPTSTRCDILS
jgi:hypothetical protein